MLLEGNHPPEMYGYGNRLPRNNLSMYISVSTGSFCFQFYFGWPFDGVSPLKRGWTFFWKILSMGGQILWGKFVGGLLHGGTNKSLINTEKYDKFDQPLWKIHLKINPWALTIP